MSAYRVKRPATATLVVAVVTAALVLPPLSAASPATAGEPANQANRAKATTEAVPGSLIVTTTDDAARDRTRAALTDRGIDPIAVHEIGDTVLHLRVRTVEQVTAAAIAVSVPGVDSVERDRLRPRAAAPDDPQVTEQWAHDQTGIYRAWDVTTGDASTRVAILDDGILGTHPDLRDNIREPQVTAADGVVRESGLHVDNDRCSTGHGTLVAGVVGAVGNNTRDIAGVNWRVSLLDIAMSSPETGCHQFADSAILAALDYAVNGPRGPVDVINLSVGGVADSCPNALQSLLRDARRAGALVVAAAGNDASGNTFIPASCNGVVSVGASAWGPSVAPYSSNNRYVDLIAPGGNAQDGLRGQILTTSREAPLDPTDYVEGTSFAVPYVAGLAALLRSAKPDLTPNEMESLLERSAFDLAPAGRDPASGWGVVQADAAFGLLLSGDYATSPEQDPVFPVEGSGEPIGHPDEEVEVFRIAARTGTTSPIPQAVAVSYAVFENGDATHAVIARSDDYADALAGSALTNRSGPLLFTTQTGPLAPRTRTELERVLPAGRTVYLLGGPNAVPRQAADDLREMGYEVVRLAGPSREETAVAVAREVNRRGFRRLGSVVLATRQNWPDAAAGGSLAAAYGTPVLLTFAHRLHPATARALGSLDIDRLYILGGPNAISRDVAQAAARHASAPAVRLAGAARDGTVVAISRELESLLYEHEQSRPLYAVAVNVRRDDGYAHILSASIIPGRFGAVFVPVEGTSGQILSSVARDYARGFGIDGVLMGTAEIIADETGEKLLELLRQG